MAPRRDSFTLLRDETRWRIAVLLCVAGVAMMVVLGVLNARSGRADSVWLSVGVGASLLVCLGMLFRLPKDVGGRIYFWITVAILVYLPYFGWVQGRTFHYWTYVMPPVLFFLMRPLPALASMALFGAYACALLVPFTPPIDIARVASSYALLVAFMYTYGVLEERAAAMLRYQSERDPLTNCLNRRTFNETLEAIERSGAEGRGCAFLLLDIDRFKAINDTHGHLVGDRVITQVAATLGRELEPGVALCRYGGEEFAVTIPDAGEATAMRLAERLRAAVEAANFGEAKVTVSAGAAAWIPGATSVAAALDAADGALYAAKRLGRNRVESASSAKPGESTLTERRRHHTRDA